MQSAQSRLALPEGLDWRWVRLASQELVLLPAERGWLSAISLEGYTQRALDCKGCTYVQPCCAGGVKSSWHVLMQPLLPQRQAYAHPCSAGGAKSIIC